MDEAREKGKKGGKKSGEVRRAKKSMREILEYLLEKGVTNGKGDKITTKEAIAIALLKKPLKAMLRRLRLYLTSSAKHP